MFPFPENWDCGNLECQSHQSVNIQRLQHINNHLIHRTPSTYRHLRPIFPCQCPNSLYHQLPEPPKLPNQPAPSIFKFSPQQLQQLQLCLDLLVPHCWLKIAVCQPGSGSLGDCWDTAAGCWVITVTSSDHLRSHSSLEDSNFTTLMTLLFFLLLSLTVDLFDSPVRWLLYDNVTALMFQPHLW